MFASPLPGIATAAPAPPVWFPAKRPLEDLTWSLLTTPYVNAAEQIVSVTASVAPSGTGELTPVAIGVFDQTLSLTLSGGQPRQIYTIQFVVTMTDGSIYQIVVYIGVLAILPTDRPQVPPVPGFGTPITWSTGMPNPVAYGLTATGANQATALPLPALTSIFTTVAVGTGAILVVTSTGDLAVYNATATLLAIYPPTGGQINALGTNAAFNVAAGQRVVFSTADFVQWTAA